MNFCKDCAHLLGKREQLEFAPGWQCVAEANVLSTTPNPLTGVPLRTFKHETCATARFEPAGCGPVGLWFTLYVKPSYPEGSPSAQGKVSAEALLSELENLK